MGLRGQRIQVERELFLKNRRTVGHGYLSVKKRTLAMKRCGLTHLGSASLDILDQSPSMHPCHFEYAQHKTDCAKISHMNHQT